MGKPEGEKGPNAAKRREAARAGRPVAPKQAAGGNMVHRKLKYHEHKLLRQHDFLQYEQDSWHEPYCIQKYHLTDREDYRRYLRLVGLIRGLMSHLRYLPADSKVRMQITQEMSKKAYDMGLITDPRGLSEIDKIGVEAFCKRRLPAQLVRLRMAGNCKIASDFIEHGHVRVGTTQVRDPAFLVPRTLDDGITWVDGSKIKQHVSNFNANRDDFVEA
uniref:Small ribosomal subunit protein uS4 N-terminal domain-containing protein n=1 Tax=Neobodo designis TaxID=312471 RepID=A0A7S1QNR4_NEODS